MGLLDGCGTVCLVGFHWIACGSAGMSFKIAIHAAAGDGLVKIYKMTVKIGTIHTGKPSFAAHGEAVATTHPCTVNHDGIHTDNGFLAILLGQLSYKLHH